MAADEDYGIDPPLVNLSTTQATSPNVPPGVNNGVTGADIAAMADIGPPANPDDVAAFGDVGNAPMYPGAGAMDDGTTVGIQSIIDERAGLAGKSVSGKVNADVGYINPKPNILDRFFSYTYRASVYLMSPEQYRALTVSKKKNIKGLQLLFQSGGAPNNSGSNAGTETPANQPQTTATQTDAGRNPAFPLDFYIDSISLETLVPGPGTRAAHSSASLKFTVIEPANITLIDRMADAVQALIPNDGKRVNYSAPSYLMVIRWYGYDENGKLVPGITGADPTTIPTDPNAIIEKFIPFTISNLNWSVAGKLVQYNFECLAYSVSIAAGTRRGTIPFDVELSGDSLGKLLGGDATFFGTAPPSYSPGDSTTADQRPLNDDLNFMGDVGNGSIADTNAFGDVGNGPPPKANAAPNKTSLKAGLMEALNQFQRKMVQQQKYEMPDTYRITFVKGPEGSPSIENATIVPPGKRVEKSSTPMSPGDDPTSKNPDAGSVNSRAKNYTITAGQQVVQVLDLAIRNSTYILDQALTLEIEDQPVLNPQKLGKTVYWYNITMNATPKLPYDNLRNDFAYDIEFIVTPYALQDLNSKYFPLTAFRGVHKSYPYWFTGKNTAVMEYQESLNNNYNITVVGTNPKNLKAEKERRAQESSMREQPFYNFQSGSTESRQGSDGKDYEPSANAAEYLYDPKGMANCKLKIIGDPAWIMQGSVGAGVDAANFSFGPFLADGTINYDASQVMFEIVWQRPEDYDLVTGLADPYARTNNKKRQPVQSRVYTTTQITSNFAQGRFEQIVAGRLYNFPKPKNPNNKATSSSVPNAGFGAGVSEFGDERPLAQTDTAAIAAQARANFAATDPGRFDVAAGAGGGGGSVIDRVGGADGAGGGSVTSVAGSQGTQADRSTIGSADEYADYGSASGVGAAGTSILVPAPSRKINGAVTTTDVDSAGALPTTSNSNPTPANPPKPVSSNGVISAVNAFLPPSVGGRGRIAVPDNPQLLSRDD